VHCDPLPLAVPLPVLDVERDVDRARIHARALRHGRILRDELDLVAIHVVVVPRDEAQLGRGNGNVAGEPGSHRETADQQERNPKPSLHGEPPFSSDAFRTWGGSPNSRRAVNAILPQTYADLASQILASPGTTPRLVAVAGPGAPGRARSRRACRRHS